MAKFRDSPFSGELEIVSTLSERVIKASLDELRCQDKLTEALRAALDRGVTLDALSDASGLTTKEIVRRIEKPQDISDDLDFLSGVV